MERQHELLDRVEERLLDLGHEFRVGLAP
jgi:hypothetical protein